MGLFDRLRKRKKEKQEQVNSYQSQPPYQTTSSQEIPMEDAIKKVCDQTIIDLKMSKSDILEYKGNNVPSSNGNDGKNFKYLAELINSGLTEITLDSDIILDEDEQAYLDGIRIDASNIVIDGRGHDIDANGKTSFFEIYGDNITFKNINFKNAYSRDSAAILNLGNSLTFDACSFENNVAERYGGVILNHEGGQLFLENCRFENNEAKLGGAVFNMNILKCDSCSFEDNEAKEGGASVFNLGLSEFYNCDFEENFAQTSGGALVNINTVKFSDCDFSENNATSGSCIASEVGYVTVESCDFEDNTSKSLGGCILNHAILNITDSSFSNGKSSNGGAITSLKLINQIKSEVHIKNSNFDDNTVERYGGVIENRSSHIYLENCKFNNGTADYGGGIYNNNQGFFDLKDCQFDSNHSRITGGAILSYEGNMEFDGCDFENNTADHRAGAIYNHDESTLIMKKSTFENNVAKGISDKVDMTQPIGMGGAICNQGIIELSGGIFKNNSGTTEGGAITNMGSLHLDGCEFEGNKNEKWGGAIQNRGVLDVKNSDFKSNTAQFGGAIYFSEQILTQQFSRFGYKNNASNCQFSGNNATEGGAVANAGVGLLTDCNFDKNRSSRIGGAVMNYYDSEITIERSVFSSNAGIGADIFNDGSMMLNDTNANCSFGPNAK